jgi:hypothetical protein
MNCKLCNKEVTHTMNGYCPACYQTEINGNLFKTDTPVGWICPRCNTVHAPDVLKCNCPSTHVRPNFDNTQVTIPISIN